MNHYYFDNDALPVLRVTSVPPNYVNMTDARPHLVYFNRDDGGYSLPVLHIYNSKWHGKVKLSSVVVLNRAGWCVVWTSFTCRHGYGQGWHYFEDKRTHSNHNPLWSQVTAVQARKYPKFFNAQIDFSLLPSWAKKPAFLERFLAENEAV